MDCSVIRRGCHIELSIHGVEQLLTIAEFIHLSHLMDPLAKSLEKEAQASIHQPESLPWRTPPIYANLAGKQGTYYGTDGLWFCLEIDGEVRTYEAICSPFANRDSKLSKIRSIGLGKRGSFFLHENQGVPVTITECQCETTGFRGIEIRSRNTNRCLLKIGTFTYRLPGEDGEWYKRFAFEHHSKQLLLPRMGESDKGRLDQALIAISKLPLEAREDAQSRLSRAWTMPDSCVDYTAKDGPYLIWSDGARYPYPTGS